VKKAKIEKMDWIINDELGLTVGHVGTFGFIYKVDVVIGD
jgi:hypothetical protein